MTRLSLSLLPGQKPDAAVTEPDAQLAAAAGENRRAFNKACPLLLAAPGKESSDAAAVCPHAEENRGAAGASWIGGPRSAAFW
jgi:hypothetical protein